MICIRRRRRDLFLFFAAAYASCSTSFSVEAFFVPSSPSSPFFRSRIIRGGGDGHGSVFSFPSPPASGVVVVGVYSATTDGDKDIVAPELSNHDKEDDDDDGYDLTLFSPCKINLFLRILRKRPDGYHDLASLFQTVGFGDTLHLKKLSSDSNDDDNDDIFTCNMEGVPTDRTNLVLRALDLIRTKTGNESVKFKADLVKRVPAQAGLGGGSGNAAAAMFGANELLGRPASHRQLVEWSAELGSDITFFLSHGTAFCTGRGEIMTPVHAPFDFGNDPTNPIKGGTKLCIVKPDVGLSTPQVFKALRYEKLSTEDPEGLLSRFLEYGIDADGDDAYVNDLEQPAFDCLPELKSLKEELQRVDGFRHVMMSGSGTSIFCIGEPVNMEGFMKDFGEREGLSVFPTEFITREEGEGVWFQQRE